MTNHKSLSHQLMLITQLIIHQILNSLGLLRLGIVMNLSATASWTSMFLGVRILRECLAIWIGIGHRI